MFGQRERMRMLAALPVLSLLLASAVAGEKPTAEGGKKDEPGTHVEMPFLIAPMSVDGKLEGYAYISSKLTTSTPTASVEVREKLAFIQDAFVRDVNAAPIGLSGDPTKVDTKLLGQRLVADARRIVGASKVVTITFKQIQFSPLHPKAQTDVPPPEKAPAAEAKAEPAKTP
ncbi:MAG: hypothetical protein JOZ72_18515 [Alphaproteobacteria bacterium]|nr:hypothetical protein [Alphaproteobacteria bacterium]